MGNSNKLRILCYLINLHEDRGDKIIVFIDKPAIAQLFSQILKRPFISGDVQVKER
jgi:hypothetical protein